MGLIEATRQSVHQQHDQGIPGYYPHLLGLKDYIPNPYNNPAISVANTLGTLYRELSQSGTYTEGYITSYLLTNLVVAPTLAYDFRMTASIAQSIAENNDPAGMQALRMINNVLTAADTLGAGFLENAFLPEFRWSLAQFGPAADIIRKFQPILRIPSDPYSTVKVSTPNVSAMR